ncbi:RNA-directed DNA polymerase [bacterium]|nr:RNA-directed DNA polymerase [bacterium]MBQ9149310.1 RNA-directed DNA polymerase [bacterium]
MRNSNKIFINDKLFYEIKKIKNRIIYIPCDELKKKLKYFLKDIKLIHSYKTNVLTCAKIHVGKKWILKMDIKDFFNSTPYCEIQKIITQVCENTNQIDNIQYYLVLTTIENKLPTGFPTSSHIANASFKSIDKKILNFCSILGVDYSRYVDDLIFSAYSKEILKIVEKRIIQILKFNSYKINSKKTKYISNNKQQNILGIVVNDNKIRISKNLKKKIRAMLYNYLIKNNILNSINSIKYKNQLAGYISYIKQVDFAYYKKLKEYSSKLSCKHLTYCPFFSNQL